MTTLPLNNSAYLKKPLETKENKSSDTELQNNSTQITKKDAERFDSSLNRLTTPIFNISSKIALYTKQEVLSNNKLMDTFKLAETSIVNKLVDIEKALKKLKTRAESMNNNKLGKKGLFGLLGGLTGLSGIALATNMLSLGNEVADKYATITPEGPENEPSSSSSVSDHLNTALEGAISGAALGSMFGPYRAAAGAVGGAAISTISKYIQENPDFLEDYLIGPFKKAHAFSQELHYRLWNGIYSTWDSIKSTGKAIVDLFHNGVAKGWEYIDKTGKMASEAWENFSIDSLFTSITGLVTDAFKKVSDKFNEGLNGILAFFGIKVDKLDTNPLLNDPNKKASGAQLPIGEVPEPLSGGSGTPAHGYGSETPDTPGFTPSTPTPPASTAIATPSAPSAIPDPALSQTPNPFDFSQPSIATPPNLQTTFGAPQETKTPTATLPHFSPIKQKTPSATPSAPQGMPAIPDIEGNQTFSPTINAPTTIPSAPPAASKSSTGPAQTGFFSSYKPSVASPEYPNFQMPTLPESFGRLNKPLFETPENKPFIAEPIMKQQVLPSVTNNYTSNNNNNNNNNSRSNILKLDLSKQIRNENVFRAASEFNFGFSSVGKTRSSEPLGLPSSVLGTANAPYTDPYSPFNKVETGFTPSFPQFTPSILAPVTPENVPEMKNPTVPLPPPELPGPTGRGGASFIDSDPAPTIEDIPTQVADAKLWMLNSAELT